MNDDQVVGKISFGEKTVAEFKVDKFIGKTEIETLRLALKEVLESLEYYADGKNLEFNQSTSRYVHIHNQGNVACEAIVKIIKVLDQKEEK